MGSSDINAHSFIRYGVSVIGIKAHRLALKTHPN